LSPIKRNPLDYPISALRGLDVSKIPTSTHPDLDPQKPEILVELDRLVDRMIALAPEKREAILAAAHRLERACVGDRATAASEGRKARSADRDMRILEILVGLGIGLHERRRRLA
jgi:hypothetical protein